MGIAWFAWRAAWCRGQSTPCKPHLVLLCRYGPQHLLNGLQNGLLVIMNTHRCCCGCTLGTASLNPLIVLLGACEQQLQLRMVSRQKGVAACLHVLDA